MKEDTYIIQAESQQPIEIEFEGPVINRVDISFPEPVLVWHNTDANSEGDLYGTRTLQTNIQESNGPD